MDKKEIKRIYKLEKRKISAEAKSLKQTAKNKYITEMNSYRARKDRTDVVNPPKRSVKEEVGNAVTHGVGALFAVVAFVLMYLAADTVNEYIGAYVYSFGLLTMFLMSCLYHSFRYGSAVKRIFRRFDYCGIYLLIGATFAPILLNYVGGTFGLVFFIAQWIIIATGVTFIGVFGPTKLKIMHNILYFVIGWSGLLLLPQMAVNDLGFLFTTLGGGIIYSLGIIPFALRKKGLHFIWHFFVLAGAIVQWLGIYLYIYLV